MTRSIDLIAVPKAGVDPPKLPSRSTTPHAPPEASGKATDPPADSYESSRKAGTAPTYPVYGRFPPPPNPVPDDFVVVRGGSGPMPAVGETFSGSIGRDRSEAGAYIPHGKMRSASVREVRSRGGAVNLVPEPTKAGFLNDHHVNVREGRTGSFGELEENPVPKAERIG
jgi:hypothetical protein